jgi:hypothetical protein
MRARSTPRRIAHAVLLLLLLLLLLCLYRLSAMSSQRPVKVRKLDADTHVVYTPTPA